MKWGDWTSDYDATVVDADGDGLSDLVGVDSGTGKVQASYSSGTALYAPQPWATIPTGREVRFADTNGDLLDDLITWEKSTGRVQVALSDGADFGALTTWGAVAGSVDVQFADMDGDGTADVVKRDKVTAALSVMPSDDSAFTAPVAWGDSGNVVDQLALPDVDGSGEADAVRRTATGSILGALGSVVTPVREEPAVPLDTSALIDDDDLSNLVDDVTDPQLRSAASSSAPIASVLPPPMRLAWQDVGVLSSAYDPGNPTPPPTQAFVRASKRVQQARAGIVRVNVFWGKYEDPRYRQLIRNTILDLQAQGLTPYATLTGSADAIEDMLGGTVDTSKAPGSKTGGTPSGVNPNPADFANFVTQAVTDLSAPGLDVHMYAIWNEPNLRGFLVNRCSNGRRKSTAPTYRALYKAGYAAVTAADPVDAKTRVLIGELSQLTEHVWPDCTSPKKERYVDAAKYLEAVANSSVDPLKTNGVAWHPYQAEHGPSRPQPKAMNPRHRSKATVGIGRIEYINTTIKGLGTAGRLVTGKSGKPVPRLFFTEFGYFNRPVRQGDLKRDYWLTERRRAKWYRQALDKAAFGSSRVPAMFLIYEMAEQPPEDPFDLDAGVNYMSRRPFDTGLIDPADGSVSKSGARRAYGRLRTGSTANGPQSRRAYCGIYRWAKRNQYRQRVVGWGGLDSCP